MIKIINLQKINNPPLKIYYMYAPSVTSQGDVGSELSVDFWMFCVVFVDSLLDLVSVMLDQSLNWPRCSVSQCANCVAFDLLCDLPQHVNLGVVGLSDLHSLQNISQP
jgi:hypothetical protein